MGVTTIDPKLFPHGHESHERVKESTVGESHLEHARTHNPRADGPRGSSHQRWLWNDSVISCVTYILLCTCGDWIVFNWLKGREKGKQELVCYQNQG